MRWSSATVSVSTHDTGRIIRAWDWKVCCTRWATNWANGLARRLAELISQWLRAIFGEKSPSWCSVCGRPERPAQLKISANQSSHRTKSHESKMESRLQLVPCSSMLGWTMVYTVIAEQWTWGTDLYFDGFAAVGIWWKLRPSLSENLTSSTRKWLPFMNL